MNRRILPGRPASRDQRVHRAMWGGLAGVLVITGLELAARHLRPGHPDLMSGLNVGLLMALPFAITLMVYLGYAQMDEYGQRLHQKAAAFGFVVAMIAVTEGAVFSEQHLLALPGWSAYLIGMAAYTAALCWLGRGHVRERPVREQGR